MKSSNRTNDHYVIEKWVKERNGIPAKVKGTGEGDSEGLLRIHFPINSSDEDLEEIEWDKFFKEFEESNLDFLYQDKKSTGEHSTFHKFVKRE